MRGAGRTRRYGCLGGVAAHKGDRDVSGQARSLRPATRRVALHDAAHRAARRRATWVSVPWSDLETAAVL